MNPALANRRFVSIHGEKTDLQYLELMGVRMGAIFVTEREALLLELSSFADGTAEGDLTKPATEFLNRVKAACIVAIDRPLKVEAGEIWLYDKDGNRHMVAITLQMAMHADMTMAAVANSKGEVTARYPEDHLAKTAHLVQQHPKLVDAFQVFAEEGRSWVGTYKVYELLENLYGPLPKAGFCSKNQLSAFKASANNPAVSGRRARHAMLSMLLPKRTMSEEEGRQFIRGMLNHALQRNP